MINQLFNRYSVVLNSSIINIMLYKNFPNYFLKKLIHHNRLFLIRGDYIDYLIFSTLYFYFI